MAARILVACEESQAITVRLRAMGLECFSCDILPCSGGHPEWHIQDDVINVLYNRWDMILAFPPCTDLATSGARWFKNKRADGTQQRSIEFFMLFTSLSCSKVAIENPVGIMSSLYRKPDQIIQPYEFGDSFSKKTCLWLKGLPKLLRTNIVSKGDFVTFASGKRLPKWYADLRFMPSEERRKYRSKTFDGIADAMARQWGSLLI